ncbi:MAG TPA: TadE/TadG family type IV pilus assembly protein [Pyrinomonadaceae bacterium]
MNVCARLKQQISHLVRREKGGATVELAIVFPILLLFFVATAELGRLFYTYTTLAKATKTGARYLSTAPNATLAATQLKAQSLVVCGYETCTGNQPDGTPKKPIVDGLNMANPAANVSVTVTTQTEGTTLVTYVTVQITGYNYPRGVFTLSGVTGAADSVIYRALTPRTRMRYMLAG